MSIDVVLERDLKWREAELASLKRLAINAPTESITYRGLLRAMWAMLYGHFEGFSKFCWDTVLDRIQMEGVSTSDLSKDFLLLALEPSFQRHRGNLDAMSIWSYFDGALPAALQGIASFPTDARLTTESNLWPNIFERESRRIGIACSELDVHRSRIKTLVARRNEIAHGKSMIIATLAEYHEYENAAFCVMHELAIRSMEVIDHKIYKK